MYEVIIYQKEYIMYREKREMHRIICSECGKDAEVPFEPDATRPVYCKECYQNRKASY